MSKSEYKRLTKSEEDYICPNCVKLQSDGAALTWGDTTGCDQILQNIKCAYEEVVKWNNNIFTVPRGKAGKAFISELNRLLQRVKTRLERLYRSFQCIEQEIPV